MIAAATSDGSSAAPTGDRPLFNTLLSVAVEVHSLAESANNLQTLICDTVVPGLVDNVAHQREIQAVDLLVQRLQGVAAFVGALAGLTPLDWHVDAASAAATVRLSDLADRLAAASLVTTATGRPDDADSGELELFA
jgi:hypothetical protein